MDQVFSELVEIFNKNAPQNIQNQINKYLDQYISFDNIRHSSNNDTLLHNYFRHPEVFPANFEILTNFFYQCDQTNSDGKSPIHLLLENYPSQIDHLKTFLSKGVSLFDSSKWQPPIIEQIIKNDNLPIFEAIIEYFSDDYLSIHYNSILALIFQYEALKILHFLISSRIRQLFSRFISKTHLPNDSDDSMSANSQFFNAISNSRHQLFQTIFQSLSMPKIVTIEMLYQCKTEKFCAFLFKYVKDGEFSKLQIKNNTFCSQKILSLLIDLKEGIYYSRIIIHNAAKQGNLDLMKKFPRVMLDSKDYKGNTPLIYAIKYRRDNIAHYLIESNESDFCHLGSKTTALHLAIQRPPNLLKEMLSFSESKDYKFHFDINVKDRMGVPPLLAPFHKQSHNQKDVFIDEQSLALLLSHTDTTICDNEGKNLLFYVFKFNPYLSNSFIEYCLTFNFKNDNIDWNELLPNIYKNEKVTNLFFEYFEVNLESMKKMVSKGMLTITPSIYQKMKFSLKNILDFLEICPVDRIFHLLLTFKQVLLYVDDSNRNVLFISAKRNASDFKETFIEILREMTKNNKNDFLFIQNKITGDTFLHTALKASSMSCINALLDLYSEEPSHFSNESAGFIQTNLDKLFQIKNNDQLTAVELAASLNIDLRDLFTLPIYKSEPSIDTLEQFLLKINNPNYIEHGEPLLFRYLKYDKFTEDDILTVLACFDKYHCDFSICIQRDGRSVYAAQILINRNFLRGFHFLYEHGGAFYYSSMTAEYFKNNREHPLYSTFKTDYKEMTFYCDILDDFSKNDFVNNIRNGLEVYARNGIPSDVTPTMKKIIKRLYLPLYSDFRAFISMMETFYRLFERMKRKITFSTDIWGFFNELLPFVNTIVRNLITKYVTRLEVLTSKWGPAPIEYSLNPITSGFCQIDRTFLMFRDNMKSLHKIPSICIPNDTYSVVYKEWDRVLEDICIFWYESFDFNTIKNKRASTFAGSFTKKVNFPKVLRTFDGKVASCDFELYNTDLDFPADQKNSLLICFENSIAFVNYNDSVMIFYYEEKLPLFVKYQNKSVDIYTKDGMIQFTQENKNSIRNFEKLNNQKNREINATFEKEWCDSDDSSEVTVYICFIEASSKMVIQHQFEYNKKSSVEDVKQFGRQQIEPFMLENDQELVWLLFSFTPLL